MAWIESHQSLKEHPKTLRLAELLDIDVPCAIGLLHCFWWWCLDYAEDGELSRFSARTIARGSLWDKDAALFVNSLVSAGFIDRDDSSTRVHDWNEYTGSLVASRQRQREIKRLGGLTRAAHASRDQQGRYNSPAHDQQDPSSQPAGSPAENHQSPATNSNQPTNSVPTVTNQETKEPPKSPFEAKGDSQGGTEKRGRSNHRNLSDDPDKYVKGRYGHVVQR